MKHAMSNDLPEVRSYRWDVEIVSYSVGSRCRDCECGWYHDQISNNINASQPGCLPLEPAMDAVNSNCGRHLNVVIHVEGRQWQTPNIMELVFLRLFVSSRAFLGSSQST
jgi:hypothetical protein